MQFHLSWQLPIKFPSSLAVKLQNFQDLLYHSNPIGIDLLGPKIKVDMTSICGNMYLYQATKFASQLKSVTHLSHFFVLTEFDVIFDLITEQKHGKMESIGWIYAHQTWLIAWYNSSLRSLGKVWHGPLPFLRTQRRISLVCWSPTTATSVSAHVETEITCWLITTKATTVSAHAKTEVG